MKRLIDAIEQEMPYCPDTDYEIGYQNGLTMAKAIVLKLDADTNVGKWIPVTERLPEKLKEVITYRGECGTSIEYTYGDGAWFFDDTMLDDVTHWMPLPEPPKGE